MTTKHAVIGIFLITWIKPAHAQRVSIDAALRTSDKSYIEATGEVTISVKPDQAFLEIGVITQGATAAAVAAQNARQTDTMLTDLRKFVSPTDQLKTTSYSVRPNYQTPKPGAPITIAGYIATNVIEVTVADLAQVGKIIDAVLQSGANNIQKLDFGLKNPQAARSQALREAALKAKESAEAIASGLGVHIVRVLSAQESGPDDEFGMQKKISAAPPGGPAPPTQIVARTVEVTATLSLRVEVDQ